MQNRSEQNVYEIDVKLAISYSFHQPTSIHKKLHILCRFLSHFTPSETLPCPWCWRRFGRHARPRYVSGGGCLRQLWERLVNALCVMIRTKSTIPQFNLTLCRFDSYILESHCQQANEIVKIFNLEISFEWL